MTTIKSSTIAKMFELLAKNAERRYQSEQQTDTTKENYDPCQSRFDLCETINNTLNVLSLMIEQARDKESSFASNADIDFNDFDVLRKKIGELYRLSSEIKAGTGVEDQYGYAEQGKSFD